MLFIMSLRTSELNDNRQEQFIVPENAKLANAASLENVSRDEIHAEAASIASAIEADFEAEECFGHDAYLVGLVIGDETIAV